MKHSVRLIALLLMFACLLACMMACGKRDDNKNKPNTNNNNNIIDDDAGIPMPEIRDFGAPGEPYVYKALVRTGDPDVSEAEQIAGVGNNGYAAIDFWVDENADTATDAIALAVYLRNSQI